MVCEWLEGFAPDRKRENAATRPRKLPSAKITKVALYLGLCFFCFGPVPLLAFKAIFDGRHFRADAAFPEPSHVFAARHNAP